MPKKLKVSPHGQMTLRDRFAVHIAAALLSNPVASQAIQRDCETTKRDFSQEVAVVAYDCADAMILERHNRI